MIALVAMIIGILIFPNIAFGTDKNNSQSRSKQKTPVKFSLSLLSPYSVANSALNAQIITSDTSTPIKIEVMSATSTQSDLFHFANNLGKRRVRDTLEIDFSQLIPDANTLNAYNFQIPVNGDSLTTLSMAGSNVYPIAISQGSDKDKTRTQYSFVTSIPSIGADGAAFSQRLKLLNFVKFQPVIDRLSMVNPEGKISNKGHKIENLLDEKRRSLYGISNISTPHSVLLNPDVIEGYNFLNQLRDKKAESFYVTQPLASTEYIADTYVPVNLGELEKQGTTNQFSNLLNRGRDVLKNAQINAPIRTLVSQSITQDSLAQISSSGIDQVIVEDRTFKEAQRPVTKFTRLKTNSASLDVATYNTTIGDNLPRSLSASGKANYLIAGTSVIALEAPSNLRGFILPLDLAALDGQTLSQYLSFIKDSPLVQPQTSSQFFKEDLLDKSLSKKLEQGQYPGKIADPMNKSKLEKVVRFANATSSIYEPESIQFAQANWMKLAVFSPSDFGISKIITPQKSEELLRSAGSKIELPNKRTLTITSRENSVPVTIKKKTSQIMKVEVRISSNRLTFPKGSSFEVELKEENTTVTIPVKARTSGSFPISIEVVSPAQSIVIVEQTATVRSTSLSGTGVFIALASTLFLSVWWASHYRKSRKKTIAPVVEIRKDKAI